MSKNPLTRQGVRNLDLVGSKPKPSQAKCSHPAEAIGQDLVKRPDGNVICRRCGWNFGPPPADPRADWGVE